MKRPWGPLPRPLSASNMLPSERGASSTAARLGGPLQPLQAHVFAPSNFGFFTALDSRPPAELHSLATPPRLSPVSDSASVRSTHAYLC